MLIDYHMHLEQGDFSPSWLRRFLDTALSRGVQEIAITEHAYRFRQAAGLLPPWWEQRTGPAQDLEEYVNLITTAQREGWPVKLGIEIDYVPGREDDIARRLVEPYPWDVVLGSVHWLGDWPFDVDPASWQGRDVDSAYGQYFATLARMATSGLFDVISHPDVIKVFGFRSRQPLAPLFRPVLEAAQARHMAVEISSAGWRKRVGEVYPAPELLDLVQALHLPVTLASDAHRPQDVAADFGRLCEYAWTHGIRQVTVFSRRSPSQRPLGPESTAEAGAAG